MRMSALSRSADGICAQDIRSSTTQADLGIGGNEGGNASCSHMRRSHQKCLDKGLTNMTTSISHDANKFPFLERQMKTARGDRRVATGLDHAQGAASPLDHTTERPHGVGWSLGSSHTPRLECERTNQCHMEGWKRQLLRNRGELGYRSCSIQRWGDAVQTSPFLRTRRS